MKISDLEYIEQKYDFKYPSLYKQLCEDGMLNTGMYGAEWKTVEYPRIKENPTLLLHAYDFELIQEDSLVQYIEEIRDEEYPGINPELKLIPFATSGAGDWICFYYNGQVDNNIPIAFVWHDSNEFDVKAKRLQDYIFLEMLYVVVDINIAFDAGDYKESLDKMFATHQLYLTPKQQEIIKEIYSMPISKYSAAYPNGYVTDTEGLIANSTFEEIIKREIDFPLLGKSFPLYDE